MSEVAIKSRNKAKAILPTERIASPKQLHLLRGWAAASGPTNKTVTNENVASIVNMAPSTVSMANAFFCDVGFLQKQSDGGFIPAPDVMNFNHAYQWNPETAAHKLTPLLQGCWFTEALLPRLLLDALPESEVIQILAQAAAVLPDRRSQLLIILDYLKAAGIVVEENGTYRVGRPSMSHNGNGHVPIEAHEETGPPAKSAATVATTFTTPTEGVVQFHVSVRVDMKEFSNWEASRVAAFFNGIAEVLNAKAGVEKSAKTGG